MAYIYKIVNDINDKIYVGKTNFSLKCRFGQHVRDSRKHTKLHRPLYDAMRKYGTEHFHIELIEETNSPEEREIYWIEQLNTYHYGYNATRGGDGRPHIDYEYIYFLWLFRGYNGSQISKEAGCGDKTIRAALLSYGVLPSEMKQKIGSARQRPVEQYDLKTGETIHTYSSVRAAELIVFGLTDYRTSAHISETCNGSRKSAGGWGWRWPQCSE